jgi:DNA-binding CsgD family transcriptional regulator
VDVSVEAGQVLLEREVETDLVAGALRSALKGNGSLVLIGGGLGNGKSALLKALPSVGGAARTRVLRASGSPLEEGHAFGVVRQLLDPVLGKVTSETRDRWLDGTAGLARTVFADDFPTGAAAPQVAVGRAVLLGLVSLVERLAAARPLLVLIDDLHWVDEPSLRFLGHLAGRVDRLPVLLVATARDGELHADRQPIRRITRAAAHALRPRALSPTGTAALLRKHFGSVDERFAVACHDLTEGSPLVLRALSVEMSHRGIAPSEDQVGVVRALRPAQLRDRMITSFRTLPEPAHEFAKALAFLGDQAELPLVGELSGLDEGVAEEVARGLRRVGVLAAGARVSFAHPFMREAVEEALAVEDREAMRRRAVRLLHDTGTPPEHVALHLLPITEPQGAWATGTLRAAADVAMGRGAPEVAARYLRRALLETSHDGEDRAVVLLDLAEVERSFDRAAAIRHVAYALALLTSPRDRAAAAVRFVPTMAGNAPLFVRREIREISRELGDPDQLTGVDRELALGLEAWSRYSGVRDARELEGTRARLDALGPEPRMDTSAERELVTVLLYGGMLTARPRAAEIARLAEEVLKSEPAPLTRAHTTMPLLAGTLIATDTVGGVSAWLDLALEQATTRNASVERALVRIEQAMVLLRSGHLAEARAAVTDAVAVDVLDWSRSNPTTAVVAVGVAIESRDAVLTERLLRTGSGWTDHPAVAAAFGILQGSAAAWRGELPLAIEMLLDCGWALDRLGWRNPVSMPWRTSVALLYQRVGKVEAGIDLAEEELVLAEAWGAPGGVGRALRVLGALTTGDRGLELSRDAVAVLELSANRLELGKALLQLGRRLRMAGRPEAEEHLGRCVRLATECGAPTLAERARVESGGTVSKVERSTLTKGERRVALMAAGGRANLEIADALQVSARAVEKHLTNSYRKLGIRRRSDLEEALRAAGHL